MMIWSIGLLMVHNVYALTKYEADVSDQIDAPKILQEVTDCSKLSQSKYHEDNSVIRFNGRRERNSM